jgi:hypothetical protein
MEQYYGSASFLHHEAMKRPTPAIIAFSGAFAGGPGFLKRIFKKP